MARSMRLPVGFGALFIFVELRATDPMLPSPVSLGVSPNKTGALEDCLEDLSSFIVRTFLLRLVCPFFVLFHCLALLGVAPGNGYNGAVEFPGDCAGNEVGAAGVDGRRDLVGAMDANDIRTSRCPQR